MTDMRPSRWAALLVLAAALACGSPVQAADLDPVEVLDNNCSGCHHRLPDGGWRRISQERKTPEGWDMTLVRMRMAHGVSLTGEEQAALVKYLSDRQGLAPSEAADYRYMLERRPNSVETIADAGLGTMCARCHSFARIALQRRDADEWLKLVNFHLGQFPTLEYQASGRDREWWKIASTEIPATLARMFPLKTAAWEEWQKHAAPDLSGTWRVVGHRPGAGDYDGTLTVAKTGADRYRANLALAYASGETVLGTGPVVVYSGYEWRARIDLGQEETEQVFAVAPDGSSMSGRWYLADTDERGAALTAMRARPGDARIMAIEPAYLRAGERAEIAILGTGLDGKVDLGAGLRLLDIRSRSADKIVVLAEAEGDAADGARAVSVGDATAAGALTLFHKIDAVRVEPDYAIARVGDNGGQIPAVTAQFEAVAYAIGPSGKPDDLVRIGVVPATWSVENFDETAQKTEDAKFAGTIEGNGLFRPAGAGPNPQRAFGTNNTGNLKITATVDDRGKTLSGTAHLITTVQRWVKPPIL